LHVFTGVEISAIDPLTSLGARDNATLKAIAGRVRALLVSGDNSRKSYNEPDAMRRDLIAAGVPAAYITCDYAGFRTLDSVIRAREVFGQDDFVVVSQPFHAERAVFLARRLGMRASAFAARNPRTRAWLKVRLREVLARNLAICDLLSHKRPKFLGSNEAVPLQPNNEPSPSKVHNLSPLR
ncbi:MAG: YdcF family protein, partial [Planctomycetes bacterium]|nr:YdcF family protein [Planctomycetota bacterium]